MGLFKVIRDCHFKNRYWNEGEIAEFPHGESANEHFRPVNDDRERIDPNRIVEVFPEPVTMSEINSLRKSKEPKTGMGYTTEMQEAQKEVKTEVRRGRPPKVKA